MKIFNKVISILILISLLAFSTIGCQGTTAEEEALVLLYVMGFFSYPSIYLSDGTSNISDPNNPITGTPVTNATVVVSNETTGVSKTAVWNSSLSYYRPEEELIHTAGQQVSLSIQTTNETVTGDPAITPDPTYTSLSPSSSATVSLPFTISWEATQGTYEATYSKVWIVNNSSTNAASNHQEIVPIAQESIEITSSDITASGTYTIGVSGVNLMTLNDAKSGSVVYVGGGTAAYSTYVNVE